MLQSRTKRLRARLHHGPLSHQVIALAATGQLDMAAAGQIRLAVVTSDKSGAVPAVLADGVVVRTQIAAIDAELARLPDSGPAQAGAVEISRPQ